MTYSTQIRGLGWDHPRCMSPLLASAADFQKHYPGTEITWHSRSLYDFGEGALQQLLADYDLIIFDHPHVGDIAENQWFINLRDKLSAEEVSDFENDSLGPSWLSYQSQSGTWGLPVDAAAQVACYRPDLLASLEEAVPVSITEVQELAKKARKYNLSIALPLVPCDAICTFLTLSANAGNPVARDGSSFPDTTACESILALMKDLVPLLHPGSLKWNPIDCYNHMSANDDICYVPYAFGYTNYSRTSSSKMIHFCDIPGFKPASCSGAIIGGAGIGISANSQHVDLSIEYAKLLCAPLYQTSKYYPNGGQPASLGAWKNETNDKDSGEFFSSTISTMENAYLRPTMPGFVHYFKEAGIRINAYLSDETSLDNLTDWLILNYMKLN